MMRRGGARASTPIDDGNVMASLNPSLPARTVDDGTVVVTSAEPVVLDGPADPSLAARLGAEAFGTFGLVLVILGAGLYLPLSNAGTLSLTFTPDDGSAPIEHHVATYPEGGGVAMGMYNFNASIRDFARASLAYGLQRGYPVYLSTKNTILKAYDGAFKDIFADVFATEFKDQFDAAGLTYEH